MKYLVRQPLLPLIIILVTLNGTAGAETGLMGYYYDDFQLDDGIITFDQDDLVMTRVDPNIDFYDGTSGYRWNVVIGGEDYGVRWSGLLRIDEAGEYGFGTISDDGSTVSIDGQLVVANGELQYYDWEDNIAEGSHTGLYPEGYGQPDSLMGPLYLEEGYHYIEVRFCEDIVYDGIELWWLKPGSGPSDIPYYGFSWDHGGLTTNPDTNWEIIPAEVLSTGASPVPEASGQARLHPAAPNPFNPRTTIAFDLPRTQAVSLRVLDVSGRVVKTLLQTETRAAGTHQVIWNGLDDQERPCPSGVYFSRLRGDGFQTMGRMTLLK